MDTKDLALIESHQITMMFLPDAWNQANHQPLTWTLKDFPPRPRSAIPPQPGVYAFVVEPSLFDLTAASGLFYIGKATNLYSRIGAYIGEIGKTTSKRPKVWKMVNRWNGHLKYYYTPTATVQDAEELEKELLNAFRPPFNTQYDAEVSFVMRAFT